MVRARFARTALVKRPAAPVRGVLGVLTGLAGCVLGVLLAVSLAIPAADRGYTEAYLRAANAGVMANAVWACLVFSAGAWLLGMSLRTGFGLPRRESNPKWVKLRIGIAVICTGWLIVLAAVGGHLRFTSPDTSPNTSLWVALTVWATISVGIPWMIYDAIGCLRERLPSLLARAASLAALPSTGIVRVSGVVRAGPDTLPGHRVYHHDFHAARDTARAVPFVLEHNGHHAWVDLHAERARVVCDVTSGGLEVRVGDQVTVVGEVTGTADPYRGGRARIGSPDGRDLHVLAGGAAWNRRLLIAATVELIAAGALASAAVLLVAFRIALALG